MENGDLTELKQSLEKLKLGHMLFFTKMKFSNIGLQDRVVS
jgi:hypothetical protein